MSNKTSSFLPSFLPPFLTSFLPSFLPSSLPPFLTSSLPPFLPPFLPSFLPSFIPSFLTFKRLNTIRMRACGWMPVRACVCAFACVCVRMCVRACVLVGVLWKEVYHSKALYLNIELSLRQSSLMTGRDSCPRAPGCHTGCTLG